MSLITKNAALLLIDIQKGLDEVAFYGGGRNNPGAEQQAAALLDRWRSLGLPIFHIRHSSQNPDSPLHASKNGFSIKEAVKPLNGEPVITKNVNSAFIGTDLLELLKQVPTQTVVLAGLTTNHCVSSTARMAGNLGLQTFVVSDAVAAFDNRDLNGKHLDAELMHQTALASIQEEFATVTDTDHILSLLKT
ncbi:MAG: cysteine hydrolase [Eudoraea sp.]|nr:cysteine hydrolase [Eudoraea sp.]NNK30589.1 cysteine hydrolase [Flavobacteriaceae bacterium]